MIDKHDLVHSFLDALCRCGDGKDYYKINHLPAEEIYKLSKIMADWLVQHDIPIQ